MDDSHPLSRPSLCTLPLELHQKILRHLDDLHALKAAILAHSSLYSAFVSYQNEILYRILSNIIPSGLMSEAILAFNASVVESETWTRERVLSILEQYRSHQPSTSLNLSIKEALQIQDLYHIIEFFSSDFLSAAQSIKSTGWSRPISSLEWCRLVRSFYRFQIHRHLFRKRDRRRKKNKPSPDFSWREQWEMWYRDYPVWELEQLACVSNYLFHKIAIPFNEIAAHDIKWGGFYGIVSGCNEAGEYVYGPDHIGTLLAEGLPFLAKVIRVETYEERYRLLTPLAPKIVIFFLPDVLQDIFHSNVDQTVLLKDYTAEDLKSLEGTQRSDPDPGPAEAWHHAHLELDWSEFVGSSQVRELQRWGYAMWDHARLVDMGFFDSSVVLLDPPEWRDEAQVERIMDSLVKRRKLYQKGARDGGRTAMSLG